MSANAQQTGVAVAVDTVVDPPDEVPVDTAAVPADAAAPVPGTPPADHASIPHPKMLWTGYIVALVGLALVHTVPSLKSVLGARLLLLASMACLAGGAALVLWAFLRDLVLPRRP